MWDWVTGVASTAWNWATENTSTITNTVSSYIDSTEKAALQAADDTTRYQTPPSLGQYSTSATRSNAGVSSFSDIKEESGTKYAQFLYYTRSYLQTKAKYEGTVPSVSYKKSGLGSKS
tara:strand:- start:1291 stop:1644 length:354 start_codon:yes stop_codon:yes gene_type:complete